MEGKKNNADYGLTLQKRICDEYSLDINEWAQKQFDDAYQVKSKQIVNIYKRIDE